MKKVLSVIASLAVISVAFEAQAQVNDNCTNSAGCLETQNSSTASDSYGIYTSSAATGGYGVQSYATGAGAFALWGDASASTGTGVRGNANSGIGVYGTSITGTAMYATSGSTALYATSSTDTGGIAAIDATVNGTLATAISAVNGSAGIGLFAECNNGANNCNALYAVGNQYLSGILNTGGITSNGTININAGSNTWGVNSTLNGPYSYSIYGANTATTGDAFGVVGSTNSSSGYAVYAVGNLAYTGALLNLSDERMKRDIATLDNSSLDQLLRLRGVSFYWKDPKHGDKLQRGFIAQEYEKVFPEWVNTDSDGMKMIQTGAGLEALEVESIRQLKAENDDLRNRVRSLEMHHAVSSNNPIGWGMGGIGFAIASVGIVFFNRKKK